MTYFIIHKEESKENLMFSSNILGEESLGSFYPDQGWVALNNMIHQSPESISNYTILDEKGKTFTLTELLDKVEKLKIRTMCGR
ncbi:MAG: hypothetical protein CMD25_09750 [Flavobacteriales bacterium]|jgi:hypothetical protein|nr:hypothetical protein [Flavobacteriales bacterium]|tara:strand:+ start:140 stop:391 length:252 start_codon:yes stop_codon:yes gene_type:complete